MKFGIIGTSIWQQNMPLLERLTIDREIRTIELARLKELIGADELVYLATCNRVEFLYVSKDHRDSARRLHRLIDFFFRGKADTAFFPNDFYHFTDREAILHLFRTAASLESLAVGETQIAGQLKQAAQDAVDSGLSGEGLSAIIERALLVAKRVKRETTIGSGAISMASLAATELESHLRQVPNATIALVGAGPMTRKMAKYIQEKNIGNLLFVNRTIEKAELLAAEFGGQARTLGEFVNASGPVDAIVTATAATEPVFDKDFLNRLPRRGHRVVCVDLAVPRDFCPECMTDERITLIDIPHLKSTSEGNLRQKFVEVSKANQIVREAVTEYLADRIEVSLKPIFHDSYRESLALANRALDDLF
ncbi:MAG: glutamyl-tRNA reductase, partial [candidate division Zixibacteria bacterium]|nr:glutamyl-tRNA reductase [candidate division Zixibacteria bacterium]